MLNQALRYKPIIDFIASHNNIDSILEVGSGSTGIGKYYKGHFTGVDLSTRDYFADPQVMPQNMSFIEADALQLPFLEGSFDLVLSADMLEHLSEGDRLRAIVEMFRVTKRYVLITFPFGEASQLIDKTFLKMYSFLKYFGLNAPLWLIEHVSNGLPNEDFLKSVSTQFSNDPRLKIFSVTKNIGPVLWFFVLVLDHLTPFIFFSDRFGKFIIQHSWIKKFMHGKCRAYIFLEKNI